MISSELDAVFSRASPHGCGIQRTPADYVTVEKWTKIAITKRNGVVKTIFMDPPPPPTPRPLAGPLDGPYFFFQVFISKPCQASLLTLGDQQDIVEAMHI